tara:strand:- start:6079 stop:6759 length:681 start_codon:yes stop_codon:yes gene_type:complete
MEIFNDKYFKIISKLPINTINLFIVDLINNKYDLDKLWKEMKKISKNDTTYLFFCNTKIGYDLIKSNEEWFYDDLIYMKNNVEYENIYIFKKPLLDINYDITDTYNYSFNNNFDFPDNIVPKYLQPIENNIKKEVSDSINQSVYKKGKKSILQFNNFKSDTKSVALLEYLIKNHTQRKDLVICLNMNKGNSAIACINTERDYIGIEEHYNTYKQAEIRIRNYHRLY